MSFSPTESESEVSAIFFPPDMPITFVPEERALLTDKGTPATAYVVMDRGTYDGVRATLEEKGFMQ